MNASEPEIEVAAKATRRRFTVEYRRTILREADACRTPGAVGALLRREGLYSSHLTTWRAARERGEAERAAVLSHLHAPRFADLAPSEVYATLLDEGTYLCSERTMYRLLTQHAEVRERRDQLRHPVYAAPELLASRPNELWSWDITKLLGPAKWTYFYLYVMLDVFSRYVVGWMVAIARARRWPSSSFVRPVPAKASVASSSRSTPTGDPP